MKKLVIILAVLIGVLLIGAEFFIPPFISSKLESKVVEALNPTAYTLNFTSRPAAKVLTGQVEEISGSLHDVKLGKLMFSELNFHVQDMFLDPIQLITTKQLEITDPGRGYIEGLVTEKDLLDFIREEIKGIDVNNVAIQHDSVTVTGEFNVGGILSGEAAIKGSFALKENRLVFFPESFNLNGLTIGGLSALTMKEIKIYDFADFPIPVQADKIESENGKIHILLKPTNK